MNDVSTMPATGLDEFLESIGRDAKKRLMKLGFNEDQIRALAEIEKPLNLVFESDIKIPIHLGKGSAKEAKTTCWVHLQGEGYITAPDGGTWAIKATLNGKPFIDRSNVKKGDRIPFDVWTAWKSTIEVVATWSEKKDTTLVLHLKGHT